MSLKNIVVDGVTLEPSNSSVKATIEITSPPSQKVLCEGKGVYHDGDIVLVTNITYPPPGASIPDPGPYTVGFVSSCKKVLADGKLVVLEGDETEEISATPKIPSNAGPVSSPISFKMVARKANQTKVLAQ